MPEPKIRFMPDDGASFPAWQIQPMSDVFTEISEKNHPEMPVLSIQQGVGTVLRDSSDRNILYDKSNLKNYKAMQKGDYIIHLRSFEGGLECSNHDGISSPAYRILRPKTILPAAYRDYFRSYEFIHNKLAVSVVGIRDGKNIDMDTFWQISMSVPCIEEQQKIADFLSSVDDVISTSEKEVTTLETQKKAVMKKIFSQEVRFKKPDGSIFPEWEVKLLGEIADVSKLAGFEFTKYVSYSENGNIVAIRGLNVKSGHLILDDVKYLDGSDFSKLDRSKLFIDDIIFTYVGTIGDAALVPENDKYYMAPNVCRIRVANENPCFIMQQLLSDWFKKTVIMPLIATSSQPALSMENIRLFKMGIPCLEEQRLIADFLSDFDEAIAAAKKELELWKKLKKGLLQQMFV